jgi:hypothetical protein
MKQTLLKFGTLPKMQSRRFPGSARHGFAAYKSDGGGPDDDDDDDDEDASTVKEEKLLRLIEKRVRTSAKKSGYQNADQISGLITKAMEGLNVEALRKYADDKNALETSIRNLSAEVKKSTEAPVKAFRTAPLKDLLDKNMDKIQKVMRAKEPGQVVVLSTRAALIMDKDDAIEEPGDMPDSIIESFSVDAFEKKRRPSEYIWEMASRRTVPEIAEYKTWLEEGDEEGAFAEVNEGALKPLMSKTLVRNFVKYKKVAGKRVYTEEFAKFRKEAYRIIEDLFNDQIMRNYSAILTTSLLSKAAAYVATALDGQYTNPTDFHAIGAVAAQIESLEFSPDLLIMNPQDKWRIGLSQTTEGIFYMAIPTINPSGEVSMMGFRVFSTTRMPVGQAMLGESGLYKIEDEPVTVRMGYGITVSKNEAGVVTDVESDIDHNRFRIIAETFFQDWLSTTNTGSFVYFNYNDVKEALTA